MEDPDEGLQQEMGQLDMRNSTKPYPDYSAAPDRRIQVLRFLGEELFGDETETKVRLQAVKNCHLLIDKECSIGARDILTLLQQVLESELDVRVIQGIPLCLKAPVFESSPHVEQLLERLCCFDDRVVQRNVLNVIRDRGWLRIQLVERVIQNSPTYHGKLIACELTASSLEIEKGMEANERNVEILLQFYLALCQDPVPMVRCAAVKVFNSIVRSISDNVAQKEIFSVVARSWILEDKDPEVQLVATKHCLLQVECSDIILGLKVGRFPWSVCENIALQLEKIMPISSTDAIQQLASLFYNKQARVRLAAAHHLVLFANHSALVPVSTWIQLYKDPDSKVRIAVLETTPNLLVTLKEQPESFQLVRDSLYYTLVYDEEPLVRATAIDTFFQKCLPLTDLSLNELEFFYDSTISYEVSWRPLHAVLKNISVGLEFHPQELILRAWTAAISNHVDILRRTALGQLESLINSLGTEWVQQNLVPVLSDIARSTKRHLVKDKCLQAITQIKNHER